MFYSTVAVFVTFVFVFVVQYENLTQAISEHSGTSLPVQSEVDRRFRTLTELDKLSVFARIRQRPKSVQGEVVLHHLQIPTPLRRQFKTTESVYNVS
jgi:hypothetical protein